MTVIPDNLVSIYCFLYILIPLINISCELKNESVTKSKRMDEGKRKTMAAERRER